MSPSTRPLLQALALSCLLLPATARVIWIPEEFDPLYEGSRLTPRQESTCGGDASLSQCGGDFPEDFCCPGGTTCLALQTDPSIKASICCPTGRDCNSIGTVSCDQSYQNATLVPASQLHSEPTVELDKCGENCCPMGYKCQDNSCVALPSKSSSSSAAAADPTSTSESTSTSSADATTTPTAGDGVNIVPGDPSQNQKTSDSFNSKSFAAGFVPGIAIGALIAACLIFLVLRKKRGSSDSYVDEKNHRDTLTDLGTSPDYRPAMHGRSISEPVVDPRFGYRNDFLRGSPPRNGDGQSAPLGNTTNIHSDAQQRPTTPGRTPKIKALFSHSPFMVPQTPSTPPSQPVPAHLKRGTLSFKISPVRALKKQKSMHSLRRQMTDATNRSNSSRGNKLERSDSQETILVRMSGSEPYTPERVPPMPQMAERERERYRPHDSVNTWISDSATSTSAEDDDTPDERAYQPAPLATSSGGSRPVANPSYTTPTRAPAHPNPSAGLGSPYTPTNANQQGGKAAGNNGLLGASLRVPERRLPEDGRRDTTFSAMMERAGLRRSDLLPVPSVPPVPKDAAGLRGKGGKRGR